MKKMIIMLLVGMFLASCGVTEGDSENVLDELGKQYQKDLQGETLNCCGDDDPPADPPPVCCQ